MVILLIIHLIPLQVLWWPRAAIGILLYFQLFSFILMVLVISFCLFYFILFFISFHFISFSKQFKMKMKGNQNLLKLNEINLKAKSIESKTN